jgi:hypothetical protein
MPLRHERDFFPEIILKETFFCSSRGFIMKLSQIFFCAFDV